MAKSKRREPENSVCVFSTEEPTPLYRWTLEHRWDEETVPSYAKKTVAFLCLNPSTADNQSLDPTLRRCRGFAKALGAGGMVIVNLFAFRSTDPKGMLAAADPIGSLNDDYIQRVASREDITHVIAGWGTHGSHLGRATHVTQMLAGRLSALKVNADGSPSHPLYLSKALTPQPYGPQLAHLPDGPSTT